MRKQLGAAPSATTDATTKTYVDAGFQPLDSDLTTLAGLTATTDSFVQAKSSAWAARTLAQVRTDLYPTQSATSDLGTALSDLGLRTAGTAYPITTSGAVTLNGTGTGISISGAVGSGAYGIDFNSGSFTSGMIRLKNDTFVVGRNNAGSADVTLFKINTLNELQFDTGTRFNTGIAIANAANFTFATSTGTKFGTATSQKIGFFNATPIVQPAAASDLGTVLSDLGFRAAGTAYPITTSGAVTLTGAVAMNATTLATDTTTGLKIGTGTTQKLGFFNATPVVQRSAVSSPTADVTSLKTAVDAVRQVLIDLGLTA